MSGESVFLFAGTSEGREMAQYLSGLAVNFKVFVATEYGGELVSLAGASNVSSARLDSFEIENEISRVKPELVIDATHPFATEVSANIKKACEKTGAEYIRLLRDFGYEKHEKAVYVKGFSEAAEYLNGTEGKIFVTTGSRDISSLTTISDFKQRLAVRILPLAENFEKVAECGIPAENIVCMQGPFSTAMNEEMLKHFSARYMLAKESGPRGGFEEKMKACENTGVTPVVISRPNETGFSFWKVRDMIGKRFGAAKKKIYVIGAGCGSAPGLTLEADRALRESELIIGSPRILKTVSAYGGEKAAAYKPEDILSLIQKSAAKKAAVVFSGDIGFFSGAAELRKVLNGHDVEYINGVSSFAYFMNRIGKSCEDVQTISLHGRGADFVKAVNENENVFMLLGGANTVENVCKVLESYGLGGVKIYVGENLSYENEKITVASAKEAAGKKFLPLSVMLAENGRFCRNGLCMPDESFMRGQVPMTKSEVRGVSVAKLQMCRDSILYDIGAGTGSVSIEAAGLCQRVYAVEKRQEAIELINKNIKKFSAGNVEIVRGAAPECLDALPPPTHAFIGGTDGRMEEIVEAVLRKNPCARFVVNAVTVETLGNVLNVVRRYGILNEDIVQLQVSKARKVNGKHIMISNNPVYIISFTGGSGNE